MAFDEKHWEIFERKKTHFCCWGGWAWVKKATELFALRLIYELIMKMIWVENDHIEFELTMPESGLGAENVKIWISSGELLF